MEGMEIEADVILGFKDICKEVLEAIKRRAESGRTWRKD